LLNPLQKRRGFVMRSLAIALAFLVCWVAWALSYSPDDPLLRILVRKGILTEEEAREIAAEAEREKNAREARKQREIVRETVAEVKKELPALPKGLEGVKLGTLTYVDFSWGKEKGEDKSAFEITRGYLNFKKKVNSWLSFRLTPDVHREDGGDLNVRIKYAYAQLSFPNLGFFTHVKAEIGQGHFPWLDFQEHINPYRCQGTMPRERAGTFNSADVGLGIMGYLGGTLPATYVKELKRHYPVFDHYAGKYGSWHFGVYNGAGYHAKEHNSNKALEGRLTLRPFGGTDSILRGLQFSYFFIRGEGNEKAGDVLGARLTDPSRADEYPEYDVDLFMVSFQHPWFVIMAEYSTSSGNNSGKWVRPDGRALDTELWSIFADVTLPFFAERLHVFFRYDWFDADKDDVWTKGEGDDQYRLYMFGLAYQLYHKNMILLTSEWVDYERNFVGNKWGKPGGKLPQLGARTKDDFRVQTVFQVAF